MKTQTATINISESSTLIMMKDYAIKIAYKIGQFNISGIKLQQLDFGALPLQSAGPQRFVRFNEFQIFETK